MRTMQLFRDGDCWCVRTPNDPGIERLFGTDVMPTPFGSCADPERVRETIARLNPDADVVVLDTV